MPILRLWCIHGIFNLLHVAQWLTSFLSLPTYNSQNSHSEGNLSCLHTTRALLKFHSPYTAPHTPSAHTSTLPSIALLPSARATSPVVQEVGTEMGVMTASGLPSMLYKKVNIISKMHLLYTKA